MPTVSVDASGNPAGDDPRLSGQRQHADLRRSGTVDGHSEHHQRRWRDHAAAITGVAVDLTGATQLAPASA